MRTRLWLQDFTGRVHLVVVGALVAGVVVFLVLYLRYQNADVWASFVEARGFRKPSYSERIYPASIFRTRANTWSNYAFVVVGVYAMALGWTDWRHPRPATAGYLVRHPIFSALFGIGCIYLGLASGFFHASLTRWGQQLDVASMYAAMLALIAMNLSRLVPRIPATPVRTQELFAFMAIVASIYLYVYKWEMSSGRVLPAHILALAAFLVLDPFRKNVTFLYSWAGASFLCLVTAVTCRQLDVAGKFTGPDSFFQGHAIWHVLCAACLGCIYLYYRSELRTSNPSAQ